MVELGTPCVYEPAQTQGAGQTRRGNRKSLLRSMRGWGVGVASGSCCGHAGSKVVSVLGLGLEPPAVLVGVEWARCPPPPARPLGGWAPGRPGGACSGDCWLRKHLAWPQGWQPSSGSSDAAFLWREDQLTRSPAFQAARPSCFRGLRVACVFPGGIAEAPGEVGPTGVPGVFQLWESPPLVSAYQLK